MEIITKIYNEIIKKSFNIPIKVVFWNGEVETIGDGEIRAVIKFNSPIDWKELSNDATLTLANAYMNKDIEIEGSIQELMVSAFLNDSSFIESPKYKNRNILQKHDKKNSKMDIEYHYDIGNDFYKLWLDNSMNYSCAYFRSEDESLENAQQGKIEHILKKLRIKPTDKLLDIGCGWGDLIITAAEKYSIKATGCTLSEEQYSMVKEKIKNKNLEDLVEIKLMDYRDLVKSGEKYEKIVSVGMFEHVGKENIKEYFECVNKLMPNRGLSLIHGISGQRDMNDESKGSNSFLNKYIFPGGYIPSIAEIVNSINVLNLHVIDLESLRLHYKLTLEEWHRRFMSNWDKIVGDKGEKFARMWDIYLQGCAAIFEAGKLDICQYLIEKGSDNTRPLTRDYML